MYSNIKSETLILITGLCYVSAMYTFMDNNNINCAGVHYPYV